MIYEVYKKNGLEICLKEIKSKKMDEAFLEECNFTVQMITKTSLTDAYEINKMILSFGLNSSCSYLNQAFIDFGLKKYDNTLMSLEKLFELSPSAAEALNGANLLVRFNKFEQTESILERYFDESKTDFSLIEPLMYLSLKLAKWDYVQILIDILEKEYAENQFQKVEESPRTHLLWCENEIYNNQVAFEWMKRNFPEVRKQNLPIKPLHNRKIKLAYLSSDFNEHPTSYLIKGLLKNHDKKMFELYIFDAGIADESFIKKEVYSYVDYSYNINNKSDKEAANLIEKLNIDILIDLNGPTKDHRLGILAFRCAPLQLSYLAYPGSVGGRVVDYIVGDNYTVQEHMLPYYNENVIKIEDTYQVNDYLSKPLLKDTNKAAYGFGEHHLILGVFNAINKIRGEVWALWMEILDEVPSALIWLLDPGEVALKNILKVTKECNIDTKRIVVVQKLPQKQHLQRLQICDLMLDTWPYSGHTSTADALFAKVPVLTKEGKNFTCRVSGGLLKAAGFEELIAKNLYDYKSKAIFLLKNKDELKEVKSRLKKEVMQSDIFHARSKTIQIENALFTVLNREVDGLEKVHINVEKPQNKQRFSIVTVCKNRLEHLKQSLPLMCKQKEFQVIVVDYACGENCGEWVTQNYPKVDVVSSYDQGEFNLSKARNLGAKRVRGDYILFVDADMLLQKDFSHWIEKNVDQNHFYQIETYKNTSMAGTVIINKNNFTQIDGYDEAFVGWGGEDDDIYSRLEFEGIKKGFFPKDYIKPIEHDDSLRQFGQSDDLTQTKLQSHKVNSMYRRIKYDLQKLLEVKQLDFDFRVGLMKNIKHEIKSLSHDKQEAKIEIKSPPQGLYNLNRVLVYTMK